jgi:hypothetical protein
LCRNEQVVKSFRYLLSDLRQFDTLKRSNPMPRRTFRRWLLAIMAATFVMFAGAVSPASADQGDKQGWSLGSDPRKRVFLRFVPANDGPRVLVLGCLRDIDSFIVLSEQDIGIGHGQAATLTLANGAARFVVEGKFEEDGAGVGRPGFASEIDADGKALQQIRPKLIPVLEGKGPMVLSVGSASRELPVAGLAKPLSGFKSVCFGQR